MSFDSSRFTFNPLNDFFGVVMQQGRVQVDADWNEWLAELSRRIQAGTLDTFGRAVVPNTTPHGFEITFGTDPNGTTQVLVGPGRMYIDGLLAENHGLPAPLSGGWTPGNPSSPAAPPAGLAWDSTLSELTGQNAIPINQQPWLHGTFPSEGGPYLVYLDVWQRAVTYIEDPDLVDKAVGVDTTGRIQTVWQVKWIDVSQIDGINCATDDSTIPAWSTLLLPPGAQLSTGVVQSTQSGPCCLAPNTGYTGLENQLYRVEIHQPKTAQQEATFKWSRDNASVATGITSIAQGGTGLVVQSTGRDNVLRFSPNDWVEIIDDWRELAGLPGDIRQINTVTDGSSTITLYNAISTADYPVDANGLTDPSRHTRMRRWDQKGKIYKSDLATVWADLTVAGATGDIPVPPDGTTLVLEDGVTVTFNLVDGAAPYQTGQFWNFAARSTDGTVEYLDFAPPRGIHHHYARLSIVDLAAKTASNCRIPWPPSSSSSDCCGCTVTIKPEDLNGNVSLQSIFDKYQNLNMPTTFCLAAGQYVLDRPLQFTSAHVLFTIEACQPNAVTLAPKDLTGDPFVDGLILADGCSGLTLDGLNISMPIPRYSPKTLAGLPIDSLDPQVRAVMQNLTVSIGLRTVNVADLTVQNCSFAIQNDAAAKLKAILAAGKGYLFSAGIFASGAANGVDILKNTFQGGGDFSAGYLHSPTATFIVPDNNVVPVNPIRLSPIGDTRLTLAEQRASAARGILDIFTNQNPIATATPSADPAPQPEKTAQKKTAAKTAKASVTTKATAAKTVSKRADAATQETAPFAQEPPAITAATDAPDAQNATFNLGQSVLVSQKENPSFAVFIPSSIRAELGGSVLPAQLRDAVISGNTFIGLSIAVLVLATLEAVDLIDNQVRGCHGGFWLLTPADAAVLIGDSQELGTFGLALATGYPLPAGDKSPLINVPAAPGAVRIYEGRQSYTDSKGNAWLPYDKAPNVAVTGGAPALQSPPPAVTNTNDQPLYQTELVGANINFTFSNLAAGFYTVTLKLAEIFWNAVGNRAINVVINGIQVVRNLDLIADSGVKVADDKSFENIPSVNGAITITFTNSGLGSDPQAKSGAIEIVPQWAAGFVAEVISVDPANRLQYDDLQRFYSEIVKLAQQSYVADTPQTARIRIENNDMLPLSAVGLLIIGDDSIQSAKTGSIVFLGNRMKMLLPNLERRSAPIFSSVASILSINRCVASNNMLINETIIEVSASMDQHAPSLVLLASDLGTPTSPKPSSEISIIANVLQGKLSAKPSREKYLNLLSVNQVPPPLNTWEFMNTCLS